MSIDLACLTKRWSESWPDLQPVGHQLRTHGESWVRFHALPGSKRYPDNEQEYGEILRRHNVLLGELVGRTKPSSLLAMTAAWSDSSVPTPRDERVAEVMPHAELWTSVMVERDEYDEHWTHIYVTSCSWQLGALDLLLRLVADDETADVIITDDRLRWLVHPYDGGVDVVTYSPDDCDELRGQHADWLPSHPGSL